MADGEEVENVEAEPNQNSRVVNLSYESLDPKEAARLANAYAKAFVATTLDLSIEPARRNAAWFDRQPKEQRSRPDAARVFPRRPPAARTTHARRPRRARHLLRHRRGRCRARKP